ncbi:MAG: beta-lactamase family protein [Bacteroidales bacterium]|nr:beta-lactamase family protein [Bacteroidales bacterium]
MMNYLTLIVFSLCSLFQSNSQKGLSDYFDKLAADALFSGAALVAKGDTLLFEKACGMSDKDQNIPNNIDTKFNLGSIAKTFTAVAIAQLVEQGKLSFDDVIQKYIDVFPDEIASKVTIHQLLTHTSGLGDIFTPAYMERKDEVETVEAFMSYVINQPLRFEPGAQHQYSNAGFIVLGYIIEKVSGENYYDYIRKHITGPLGMNDTDFYKKSEQTPNLARGYTYRSASMQPQPQPQTQPQQRMLVPSTAEERNAMLRDNFSTLPLVGNPSGGAYSTVRDMLKFSLALNRNTLISKEYTDMLTRGRVESRMGMYGYGFEILEDNGYRTVGHSGGAPGVNGLFRMLVDKGYTIVILANADGAMRDLYQEIVSTFVSDF